MTTTRVDPAGPSDSDARRRSRRSERYALRHRLWSVTKSRTLRSCGRGTRGDAVEVHRTADGRATTTGLVSCSSIWSCPVCSAHIRQERAGDIDDAFLRWSSKGGSAVMVTLTLRHWKGADLGKLLDAMYDAWRRTIRGAPWKRQRDRLGIIGFVKAAEVTYGEAAGWHPHLHVLLFTGAMSDDEREAFTGWLHARWSRFLGDHHRGLKPKAGIGVKVQAVNEGIGQYVAKVQEATGRARGLGLEIARGDLKKGRRAGQRLPFDILADTADGCADDLELWWEYERATRGRRAIEWSRGLRDALGMDSERDDEEITADDAEISDETLLGTLPARTWHAITTARQDWRLLDAAETGGWDAVLALLSRLEPGPPGV